MRKSKHAPALIKTATIIPVTSMFRVSINKEQTDAIDNALSLVYERLLKSSIPVLLRAAYTQGMIDTQGILENERE